MADSIVPIADGFWNIRGSFRVFGVLDIGTQASLVRLASGGFALLDSYTLGGGVLEEVMRRTDGGRAVEAVLNLHPFHTVHVATVHAAFPNASHYGTRRHHARAPTLRWADGFMEDPSVHERFAADFDFTVPEGVTFIPDDEKLHFASVLAIHKASGVLHVDDTLTYTALPLVGGLSFHPTLGAVLERRAGAVAEFRAWAAALVARCATVKHLCTAHMRALPPTDRPVAEQVQVALAAVERTLRRHEARWG